MPQQSSPSAPLLLLSRVLLLVAVLTGLGAMHVLGSDHGSQHNVGQMTAMASTPTAPAVAPTHEPPTAAVGAALSHPGVHGHELMTGCVLFTATGIALLGALLAAARHQRTSLGLPVLQDLLGALGTARRGPPSWPWPRIALCVIRI